MDRFRRGEQDRDDPDTYHLGAGESYRPGGGGGGRGDAPRPAERRDDRRDERRDTRREEIDSYIPTTSSRTTRPKSRSPDDFRRRSRSPAGRGRDETYPARTRTPPRRFSPRRDTRPRSPPRRRSRSPYGARPRSTERRVERDFSSDRRRSPRRDRPLSPDRNRYDRPRSPARRPYSDGKDSGRDSRPRSRTPPHREEYRSAPRETSYRRNSPSPRAAAPHSNNTSRRSSPPVHPDRVSMTGSGPRSPPRREPSPPGRFPDRTRDVSPRDYDRDTGSQTQGYNDSDQYRNGTYDRAPPSGPSRGYGSTSHAPPPSGPASSASISAHNRSSASSPSTFAAPSGPRGAPPGRFDAPREFSAPSAPRGRGGAPPYRGSTSRTSSYQSLELGPGAPRGSYSSRGDYNNGASSSSYPRGGGYSSTARSYDSAAAPAFPFRSNNSTSTTYPQTKRFNTTTTPTGPASTSTTSYSPSNTTTTFNPPNAPSQNHLTTKEQIIPGGKLFPSGLPPDQERKIKMLEADAERLRLEIDEKQKAKREALREWEVRHRESEGGMLRSDLAEKHLLKLTDDGESGGMGTAF